MQPQHSKPRPTNGYPKYSLSAASGMAIGIAINPSDRHFFIPTCHCAGVDAIAVVFCIVCSVSAGESQLVGDQHEQGQVIFVVVIVDCFNGMH